MDRSWIYKSLPFDPVYIAGVDQFMQHVRSRFRADDKIKCPCRQCLNRKEKSQANVEEDIHINGFCRWYTSWIHHGEVDGEIQDENGQPPLMKICYGMKMTSYMMKMSNPPFMMKD